MSSLFTPGAERKLERALGSKDRPKKDMADKIRTPLCAYFEAVALITNHEDPKPTLDLTVRSKTAQTV